ncbi:MAG: N-acetylmuramoyl-L-alanine amidase [Ignavibacteriaceae bacterium]|nr:N-acetylmuramoyl-L-alanine amidase [Ignavibacteriaceae bacterium]
MRTYLTLILALLFHLPSFSQNKVELSSIFEEAAIRFGVPSEILKGVAFTESRFKHNVSIEGHSCINMPQSHGIMGLRDDHWFGNSLTVASSMLNISKERVATDIVFNINGAAAYLAHLAERHQADFYNLNSWKSVLENYSGIPQGDLREFYSFDVLKILHDGIDDEGLSIQPNRNIDLSVFGENVNPENKFKNIESEDYGPAVWSPSPNFTTGAINHVFSVVHTTQGSFAASVSWLQNPDAQASTHYIIRSSDGYIIQLVREQNRAWHVVCWNPYMLGVEHEGFVDNPAWYTDAMYLSSAALFRHFSTRYSIPFSRNKIIGHNEWQNSQWVSWMSSNYPSINTGCNSHTDPGQYWDWNFYMQLVSQDTTRPSISSYSPSSSTDSVFSNAPIKIRFNQRMKRSEAQAAFTITPSVPGSFSWEDFGKTLVFKPSTLFSLGTVYNVNYDSSAMNYNGHSLRTGVNFSFVTKSYSSLNLESAYPANNAANISTTVRIIINFDTPILQSSLAGAIALEDSSGNQLGIKNIVYQEVNTKGILAFSPQNTLIQNSLYKVKVKGTIKNIFNAALGDDIVIEFRTYVSNFVSGTLLDGLEALNNWKDPNYSGSTVGTDPNATAFNIVSDEYAQGTKSGKISYMFTGTGGVCRTFNADKPAVSSVATDRFGMWVYGDLSFNNLEFWFYYNSTSNAIVPVGTLDWTGWKFVEIPVSSIGGSGTRLFHSVVVKQTANGSTNNAIYIDGIQKRPQTPTDVRDLSVLVMDYYLDQNFPNPFNPQTKISFTLKTEGLVNLSIYNILGDKVTELLNDHRSAGLHTIELNAETHSLSSGVYFYTIRSGDFYSTRKMVLIK